MEKDSRKRERRHENRPGPLGELIHAHVRRAIEVAVHEEGAVGCEAHLVAGNLRHQLPGDLQEATDLREIRAGEENVRQKAAARPRQERAGRTRFRVPF